MTASAEERALRRRYWEALRSREAESAAKGATRRQRERTWRDEAQRRIAAREETGHVWQELMRVRRTEANLAGAACYLDFRWRRLGRTAYAPADLGRFHYAVEEWVSPVLVRIHEQQRMALGVKTLRPWDTEPVPTIEHPMEPDPDIQALLTSAGKRQELRALVHVVGELRRTDTDPDGRSRLLRHCLLRWAGASMIDTFEQWAYTHPDDAMDPAACADRWKSGWLLFVPGIDWTGLDEELETEWHDRWPLFLAPLHAMEGSIGQLAAMQLWSRYRDYREGVLEVLRMALTQESLDAVYAAAGIPFALDEHTVREASETIQDALAMR